MRLRSIPVVLALLCAVPVQAAVSLNVAGASTRTVVTSGVAANVATATVGACTNCAAVVSIVTNGNTSITSCTFAGGTLQTVSTQQENTFVRFAYLLALINPSTGSQTVNCTFGANDTVDVAVVVFNGVVQTFASAFLNATGANGGGGPVSISVTTASGDATVVDAISNGGALTFTGSAPSTSWWNDTNLGGHYAAAGYALSTSTSDAFSWSQGFSDVWGAAGIHVVASSGGGGGCTAPAGQLTMMGVANCKGDDELDLRAALGLPHTDGIR